MDPIEKWMDEATEATMHSLAEGLISVDEAMECLKAIQDEGDQRKLNRMIEQMYTDYCAEKGVA